MRGRPPSPAAVRARELLTADPQLSTKAALSQLQSEGLRLSAASVRIIAADVGRPAGEPVAERIEATRELLRSLAATVGYAELHRGQPAVGWRQAVATKLGLKSPVFVGQAWREGVALPTRAKWSEIISRAALASAQACG